MTDKTSAGSSKERVSDKRLAELVSHYGNVDEQHNGWWVALYWCLRELQEWRKGCTGKRGSQANCVDGPPFETFRDGSFPEGK